MKVGFITTINTNIGDDFIREGILNLLKIAFADRKPTFTFVNKHIPYSVYPSWHPLRYAAKLQKIPGGLIIKNKLERPLSKLGFSKFDSCDLIIQSGAPVLWPDCQQCEWNLPIWQHVVGRLSGKTPVFNIAAGSCYPWERQPEALTNPGEFQYAKMIGGFCKLTTTRDTLANKLFLQSGVTNTLMPCTAFFVDPSFENRENGKYILVNYMTGGGHFDWGQDIDKRKWEQTIKETISHLKENHEVRFICHDEKEVALAKQLDPSLRIHFPKTVNEYLQCVRGASLGINNRMHASVAMASVGVPSVSVCTDTRLLMLAQLGLPIMYVKDSSTSSLLPAAENLLKNVDGERSRLFELKKKTFETYSKILNDSLA